MQNNSDFNHKTILEPSRINDIFTDCAPTVIIELFKIYLTDAKVHLENIEKFITQNECEQLWKCAHALKGASMNVEAEKVGAIAQAIEQCGRKNETGKCLPLVQALSDALEELPHELKKNNWL